MKRLLLTAVFCSLAVPLYGQHQHAADHKPAALMSGLGELHHPVSTSNAEAQKFFDQGLRLIYAFNHEEAARSFKRAAELDPQLAMAHWGYALAVGPNYNEATIDAGRMKAAVEAVEKARALAARATDGERALIEALAKRFTLDANPDGKKLAADYSRAMGEVAKRFPDDLDAVTLYADSLMNLTPWQLWTRDGKPAAHTEEIVALLESVLRRDPQHIGANHLYIHAVEASRTPERALPSAERLGKLAPAAGHLVHMPAHIYIRTGDYAAAARVNEDAAAADRAYIKAANAQGVYPMMYYSHNLHFLVESYGRAGQFREAQRSARQLAEHVRPHVKAMPMIEGFLPSETFVLLRFARWDDVLKQPEPDRATVVTHAVWQFARGLAHAARSDAAEAEKARQSFAAEAQAIAGDTPFGLNTAASVLKVAAHLLDARIAQAKNDGRAAVEHLRRAVEAEDALNYDEPPGWYYPVRESLGAALLLNGDAAGAERVFREDLERNPRNGRSLFGLTESLKAQGRQDAARSVQREYERAWKNADTQLNLKHL
jgi:tetratricopeptide (TPR) repeat protein